MLVMEEARSRRSVAGKKGGAPVGNSNARKKDLPKATSAPTPKAASKREQSSSLELPSKSRFNVVKPAPTAQPADNQACLKRFFGKENASNLEVLLMNFGLKPDDITMIRKIAKEVVAEWEISKKEHTDYTDWSQHLIATMRIKVKDKQQAKGKTATETVPPSTADYQYDGGFGSKDV